MKRGDDVSDEINKSYKDFLGTGENVTSIFYFALITVLTTQNRVLILKGLPRNIISMKFKDVEFAGFVTKIKWLSLIISLFLFAFSHFFHSVSKSFWMSILGLKSISFLIGILFITIGVFFLLRFIHSLFGKLTILLEYNQKPIRLTVPYNHNLIRLINHIESNKK